MDNVGPSGELENDRFIRELLTQRNTSDPGCKLSPAEVIFGRHLRDTLPYIDKEKMAFNNSQFSDQWRYAWRLIEEAMKVRYVKTLEYLKEHSRPLPSLQHGDDVQVQNQSGTFPKIWGKSGVIVEGKNNDQYVVKVAGPGRLTLRNRRFLRMYEPHYAQGPMWGFDYPGKNHPGGDGPSATLHIKQEQPVPTRTAPRQTSISLVVPHTISTPTSSAGMATGHKFLATPQLNSIPPVG